MPTMVGLRAVPTSELGESNLCSVRMVSRARPSLGDPALEGREAQLIVRSCDYRTGLLGPIPSGLADVGGGIMGAVMARHHPRLDADQCAPIAEYVAIDLGGDGLEFETVTTQMAG